MLDRLRRLASVRDRSLESVQSLAVEAIERGVHTFESQAPPRLGPPTPPSPVLGLSASGESRRIVRREGKLTFGTREAVDRREVARGGRRTEDRREARQVVVDRVLAEVEQGHTPKAIAAGLTADGITTAGGNPWNGAAIQQLIRLEMDRRAHSAWTPTALRSDPPVNAELLVTTEQPAVVLDPSDEDAETTLD
jgi:hypothetical protein